MRQLTWHRVQSGKDWGALERRTQSISSVPLRCGVCFIQGVYTVMTASHYGLDK